MSLSFLCSYHYKVSNFENYYNSSLLIVNWILYFLLVYLGKRTSLLRLRTALRTDERVRLMNEIISGIQVIKMYTWEKPFAHLVALARRYEIKSIRGTSYIKGILLSFIIFSTRFSLFASILAYVLFDNSITAEQVFVLQSFYNILRQSMTVFFAQGIGIVAETHVSISRLNKFLTYEENNLVSVENVLFNNYSTKIDEDSAQENHTNVTKESGVVINHITAKWSGDATDNTLTDIYAGVQPGRLVAVIGPVGSGKSSLLQAILKELPLQSGTIDVKGEISYASQEPWLFAGSVRQNILFGLPMDRHRYRTVVKKCALERDFTLFPYGDKTIVGERGVSLSGGQRARINLARSVYKQADIYLLDDPLSAVDTHVGKQLFDDCITGYLREKTVILITHQLQYLKEVDQIIILENGEMKAHGSYSELQESGLDFAKLLHSQPVEEGEQQKPALARQSSIASVASFDDKTTEAPLQVEEQKGSGKISAAVYKSYFSAGGNCCVIMTLFSLFFLTQLAASGGDYFITYW